MPVARASEPMIGPDSAMSSAFPAGTPSRISVSTTSARPASCIRCAVVEPTKPPPTTVTFLRIPLSRLDGISSRCFLQISRLVARAHRGLHIFDDGRSVLGRFEFFRAGHQTLQIVCNLLLLNGARDAVFD